MNYSFQQCTQEHDFKLIEIDGIDKKYFLCIIQYLYSDNFYL